jgi:ABC-2 type transport system ATP-binding protein
MSAITASGVAKSYGDVPALRTLDLSIERGELYGLLGPNGAGKTTAIQVLTGQIQPDEGTVSVLGTDPTEQPVAVRERAGILPEKEAPPSFLTPREYFAFVGSVRDIDTALLERRVAEWADMLAFEDHLDTLATDCSRGTQQKVMITAAFLHDPDAVFIDEPLANLDPIVQERVKRHLASYAADNAVLISTHHVEVAEELCTRVGIVDEGRVVAERQPTSEDGSLLETFVDSVEATEAITP